MLPVWPPAVALLIGGWNMESSTDKFIDELTIRKILLVGGGVIRNVPLKGASCLILLSGYHKVGVLH